MNNICVSVFMLAYNQEKYIAQAIEGVLMQQTDFIYQLVIGEDCSTDATREICKDYYNKNPDKIKLLLNDINIGLGSNYVKTYKECKGDYVAICDGDDYWIDPLKLQKQVNFLREHPDYKIVYTNNFDLFPTGNITGPKTDERSLTTTFSDLVMGNYIPSVTVLFKNEPITADMELWIGDFPFGDWPTYLKVLANGGEIFFLDDPTSVYRKNFGTSTALRKAKSKMGEVNLAILQNLLKDKAFCGNKENIISAIIKFQTGLMASYNKEQKFKNSLNSLFHLLSLNFSFKTVYLYVYSLKKALQSNFN